MYKRTPRLFAINDTVAIAHDGWNNYPKGTAGIITFVGAYRRNQPMYHFTRNDETFLLPQSALVKI